MLWSEVSNGGRQRDEGHPSSDTNCWEWGRPPVRKRSHNNLFWRKNLRMGDMKERNTHTHTERERGTKNISINNMAIVTTMNNQQQPLLKVTRSLYIVTHLGQLPFMLFTQMARTWAIKEDSVNTSIIHWYSRRWISYIQSLNPEIRHISGKNNAMDELWWRARFEDESDMVSEDEDCRRKTKALQPSTPSTRTSMKGSGYWSAGSWEEW